MVLGSKLITSVGSDGGFVGLGASCTRPFDHASRSNNEAGLVSVMGTLYPQVFGATLAAQYGSVVPRAHVTIQLQNLAAVTT